MVDYEIDQQHNGSRHRGRRVRDNRHNSSENPETRLCVDGVGHNAHQLHHGGTDPAGRLLRNLLSIGHRVSDHRTRSLDATAIARIKHLLAAATGFVFRRKLFSAILNAIPVLAISISNE